MPEMNSAENLYKCINRKLRPREEQFKRSRGQAVEANPRTLLRPGYSSQLDREPLC
jgi:hypothetical protein